MRTVLLRIVFDTFWQFQSANNELLIGVGWILLIWLMIFAISQWFVLRHTEDRKAAFVGSLFWLVIPAILLLIKGLGGGPMQHTGIGGIAKSGIPLFGYGFMIFVGVSSATVLAVRRAPRAGIMPTDLWDLVMWLIIPGIIGSRLIYLLQNSDRVFAGKSGGERLVAAVALWDGGIVFYGSIIGGVIGFLTFCYRRRLSPGLLADHLMPSLFVGLGFGRIGCFLYGCCYGAACDLPWAVRFPRSSMTFPHLVEKGVIAADATSTIPLHPTQIYSSILAFLLAGFLLWYTPRRPYQGAVVAIGCMIYSINRFSLEVIRNDEPTRFGTPFTFSQLVSIGVFTGGTALMLWLHGKNRKKPSPQTTAG